MNIQYNTLKIFMLPSLIINDNNIGFQCYYLVYLLLMLYNVYTKNQ